MAVNFGRPREYDREKIANDLIAWALEETSTNLCQFSRLHMLDPDLLYDWSYKDEHFARAYRLAKTILGERRERMYNEGSIKDSAYKGQLRVYDLYYKHDDYDILKYKNELAKQLKQFEHDLQNSNKEEMNGKVLEFLEKMNELSSIKNQSK
jgi:hypothetical protein